MQNWLSDEIFDRTKLGKRNAGSVLGLNEKAKTWTWTFWSHLGMITQMSNLFPVQIFHLERLVWQVVVVEAHLCLRSRLSLILLLLLLVRPVNLKPATVLRCRSHIWMSKSFCHNRHWEIWFKWQTQKALGYTNNKAKRNVLCTMYYVLSFKMQRF